MDLLLSTDLFNYISEVSIMYLFEYLKIASLTIVCSTVYSDADERKHQSSTSLAFV